MKKRNSLGWADRPEVRRAIRYGLYGACGLLLLAELLVQRHTVMPLEELPGFYPLYGFLSLITVVLLAKGLRRLVSRPETYYSAEEEGGRGKAEEAGGNDAA